jgi:hypothetical protein
MPGSAAAAAAACHTTHFFFITKITDRSTGSCIVEGKTYLSETSVPRDHPCHYCICYLGKIDCFWKQCAHIPDGCQVMAFQDTCNPSLYICGKFSTVKSYRRNQFTVASYFTSRHSREGARGSDLRTPTGQSSAAGLKFISIDESLHDQSAHCPDIGAELTVDSAAVFCSNLYQTGGGSSFPSSTSARSPTD